MSFLQLRSRNLNQLTKPASNLTSLGITKPAQYVVITIPAAKTKPAQYAIVKSHSTTKSAQYVIAGQGISITKAARYAVIKAHSITKAAAYSIDRSLAITKPSQYTVNAPHTISIAATYTIFITPGARTVFSAKEIDEALFTSKDPDAADWRAAAPEDPDQYK